MLQHKHTILFNFNFSLLYDSRAQWWRFSSHWEWTGKVKFIGGRETNILRGVEKFNNKETISCDYNLFFSDHDGHGVFLYTHAKGKTDEFPSLLIDFLLFFAIDFSWYNRIHDRKLVALPCFFTGIFFTLIIQNLDNFSIISRLYLTFLIDFHVPKKNFPSQFSLLCFSKSIKFSSFTFHTLHFILWYFQIRVCLFACP